MLAPWKDNYDKPRRVFKSRDSTLPTEVHILKFMVFQMYKLDVEKAEEPEIKFLTSIKS